MQEGSISLVWYNVKTRWWLGDGYNREVMKMVPSRLTCSVRDKHRAKETLMWWGASGQE